ncbi:MAG: LON peptidase substrate-binding domain-containing protein [Oceanospirillum sp.]|nr:LON peptidase substrate-binding domain-containing protein [Oceanospirillum sp.]
MEPATGQEDERISGTDNGESGENGCHSRSPITEPDVQASLSLPGEIYLVLMPRVLFPQTFMALNILEPRYERMVKACLADQQGIGILFQPDGIAANAPEEQLKALPGCIGTYGMISDWYPQPDNTLTLNLDGFRRFKIGHATQADDGLVSAQVEWLPEEDACEISNEHQHLVALLQEITRHPLVKACDCRFNLQDARSVSLNLSHLLPLPDADKQTLLECSDASKRLTTLSYMLSVKGR